MPGEQEQEQAIEIRVNRGIALLDEKHPDWYQKINIESLSIASMDECILGQIYGSFIDGLKSLEIPAGRPYGFVTDWIEILTANALWKKAILQKRIEADPQISLFEQTKNRVLLKTL